MRFFFSKNNHSYTTISELRTPNTSKQKKFSKGDEELRKQREEREAHEAALASLPKEVGKSEMYDDEGEDEDQQLQDVNNGNDNNSNDNIPNDNLTNEIIAEITEEEVIATNAIENDNNANVNPENINENNNESAVGLASQVSFLQKKICFVFIFFVLVFFLKKNTKHKKKKKKGSDEEDSVQYLEQTGEFKYVRVRHNYDRISMGAWYPSLEKRQARFNSKTPDLGSWVKYNPFLFFLCDFSKQTKQTKHA